MMMPRRGLGLDQAAEPIPPAADHAAYEGPPPEMGDGWSDAERAYRDEVEADPENELYLRAQEWKRKWLQKAEEFGLDSEKAMRVLDSIGDFDAQEPGDPGYGEEQAY